MEKGRICVHDKYIRFGPLINLLTGEASTRTWCSFLVGRGWHWPWRGVLVWWGHWVCAELRYEATTGCLRTDPAPPPQTASCCLGPTGVGPRMTRCTPAPPGIRIAQNQSILISAHTHMRGKSFTGHGHDDAAIWFKWMKQTQKHICILKKKKKNTTPKTDKQDVWRHDIWHWGCRWRNKLNKVCAVLSILWGGFMIQCTLKVNE